MFRDSHSGAVLSPAAEPSADIGQSQMLHNPVMTREEINQGVTCHVHQVACCKSQMSFHPTYLHTNCSCALLLLDTAFPFTSAQLPKIFVQLYITAIDLQASPQHVWQPPVSNRFSPLCALIPLLLFCSHKSCLHILFLIFSWSLAEPRSLSYPRFAPVFLILHHDTFDRMENPFDSLTSNHSFLHQFASKFLDYRPCLDISFHIICKSKK